MAQVLERVCVKPREVIMDATQKKPPQIRSLPEPIIQPNGNGKSISDPDPPHDWLDDPLVALERSQGPYTFDNADEYLDSEPVELYNGWLVRQEMADYEEREFAGDLQEHISIPARVLGFGRALPDQVECLLDDGFVVKPDVCLISWRRRRERVRPHGPNNRPTLMGSPEFVVEIRSPSNRRTQEKRKRERYFRNGAQIIWDVDEKKKIIYVYRAESPEKPQVYKIGDEIDCEPLLPGWRRQVSDLFTEQAAAETILGEVAHTLREEGEKVGEKRGKQIGREEGEKVGEKRGKQIGREEGEKIAKQDALIRLLEAKFTTLSEDILETIQQTDDIDQLDTWFNQALTVQSLDELSF